MWASPKFGSAGDKIPHAAISGNFALFLSSQVSVLTTYLIILTSLPGPKQHKTNPPCSYQQLKQIFKFQTKTPAKVGPMLMSSIVEMLTKPSSTLYTSHWLPYPKLKFQVEIFQFHIEIFFSEKKKKKHWAESHFVSFGLVWFCVTKCGSWFIKW